MTAGHELAGDAFPLTPMQQAYWVGRRGDHALGGVGCQGYFEFDGTGVDPDRLGRAAKLLVRRHPMLRARFLPDCRQRIGADSLWPGVTVDDLSAVPDPAPALAATRELMTGRCMDAESGVLFDVRLSLLAEERSRLHVQADLLVADAHSIRILLADLLRLYLDPDEAADDGDTGDSGTRDGYSFADYLRDRATAPGDRRERERAYWAEAVPELPGPPALPTAAAPETLHGPVFTQRRHALDAAAWQRFQEHARRRGVTPAMALATAYGEAVGRWSAENRFLLNVPVLGRWDADPRVQGMVGDFSNTVLVPLDTGPPAAFADRAAAFQRAFRRNLAHSRDHFGVEVLREITRRDPARPGSAPVVFTYHVTDGDFVSEEFRRTLGELTHTVTQTPQVWLDHQVFQLGGRLVLKWDAVEGLFPPDVLDGMFAAYTALVDRLAASPDSWRAVPALPVPGEQVRARERRNDTAAPVRRAGLHERFFALARSRPDRPAVVFADRTIDYGCLADAALRVAAHLTGSGLVPGEPVGVCMPRGTARVAALLGVLAAGGAYVPLSPGHPAAVRERVVLGAGARRVLAPARGGWPEGVTAVPYERALNSVPLSAPRPVDPDRACYIIATSGSTGAPKLVQVPHRAAVNTVEAVNDRYGVGPHDRTAALAEHTFDLSVYDLFGLLSAGGSLLMLSEEEREDPDTWPELVERHRVTLWQGVPATLEMLLDSLGRRPLPSSLRLALLSGDWIGVRLPDRLARAGGGRCRLVALGGPTETAIWSNVYEVGEKGVPAGWPSVPYGHPLRNQLHRVVNRAGRDCCDWVPGELWVGGPCLADGYAGDPELTAERFTEHDGRRWYRTGDIVRYRPGGTLEFLGRDDLQVQLNGYRVEPGEVEAALREHGQVAEAVAVVDPASAAPRLTAFVTPRDELVDTASVAAHLRDRLPSHLRPSVCFVVGELPRTANGKTDRATLRDWAAAQPAETTSGEPPRPGWETCVAREWSRLLKRPVRDREDDFYALGGDSVLATRLARALRARAGSALPVRHLFAVSTVRAMAELFAPLPSPPDPGPETETETEAANATATATEGVDEAREDGTP
ncbi:amino acid adenylation domain-containing protein [Streptomyces sp. NPDC005805]|uniref:non-ribosomal peptide synthetase n=1 Tax=Streptomyces sp. NPDC005805 TaxID=3157068 RepID=UPI0033D6EBBF